MSAATSPVADPNRADAALSFVSVLAIALPFFWCFTRPPSTNFWPLAASSLCAAVLLLVSSTQGLAAQSSSRRPCARVVAAGLLAAALVSSSVGLAQYFGLRGALLPWVYDAPIGQAMGNLRQRNQQATLLSLGVWALVWWVAQRRADRAPAGSAVSGASGAGRGLASDRWGGAATWTALAVLAVGSAATASRTGLMQWLLLLALALLWRQRMAAGAWKVIAGGLALYTLASWALPALLWRELGVQGSGVFSRVTESYGCGSRGVLWSNVLDLIALRPWLGWGWGELDYAHYITLFPGERFCALLDNAHNLPLQLAVELGVPAVLLICGSAGVLVWRARPWAESAPPRQLAWGVLLVIGAHSMLEFPLWYGPFQLAALCALALLLAPTAVQEINRNRPLAQYLKALAAILIIVFLGVLARQYSLVSQLYQPAAQRSDRLRLDAQGRVLGAPLFADAARFAHLTTLKLTPANAAHVHALAKAMLHYSPEPKVVERLIESAELLGLSEEAQFHRLRYAAAYPADYSRWTRAVKASHALGN